MFLPSLSFTYSRTHSLTLSRTHSLTHSLRLGFSDFLVVISKEQFGKLAGNATTETPSSSGVQKGKTSVITNRLDDDIERIALIRKISGEEKKSQPSATAKIIENYRNGDEKIIKSDSSSTADDEPPKTFRLDDELVPYEDIDGIPGKHVHCIQPPLFCVFCF